MIKRKRNGRVTRKWKRREETKEVKSNPEFHCLWPPPQASKQGQWRAQGGNHCLHFISLSLRYLTHSFWDLLSPMHILCQLQNIFLLFISSSFILAFSGTWYLQQQPFLDCPQSCPPCRLSFSFSSFFSYVSHSLSSFPTGSFQTSVCWCCSSLVLSGVLWRHRDKHMFPEPCWTRSSKFL